MREYFFPRFLSKGWIIKMKKCALIGSNVVFSKSYIIHSFIFKELNLDASYGLVSIPEEDFDNQIEEILNSFDALNVTIPYKLRVIPYLKGIYDVAEKVKSVNTISNKKGYNTDGEGLMLSLASQEVDVKNKKVLVLGAGGAARSIIYSLVSSGADVYVFNRTYEKAVELYNEFKNFTVLKEVNYEEYDLLVNCTSVGMHDETASPIDEKYIKEFDVICDIVNHPRETKLLKLAKQHNKKAIDGYGMLFYQAYISDCIFFDLPIDVNQAKRLYHKFLTNVNV